MHGKYKQSGHSNLLPNDSQCGTEGVPCIVDCIVERELPRLFSFSSCFRGLDFGVAGGSGFERY